MRIKLYITRDKTGISIWRDSVPEYDPEAEMYVEDFSKTPPSIFLESDSELSMNGIRQFIVEEN